MEEIQEKLYYKIGEAAKILNVKTSLLRFWEDEIDLIKPHKNKKGDRFYTSKDLDILKTVYNLTKERGYTLRGAKELIKNSYAKEQDKTQIINTLQNVKRLLLEIKDGL
jgi:DNA-binding transcriptional MerR regulator